MTLQSSKDVRHTLEHSDSQGPDDINEATPPYSNEVLLAINQTLKGAWA